MLLKIRPIACGLGIVFSCLNFSKLYADTTAPQPKKHIILFIWDGLRPDSISQKDTPNLFQLKESGTWFADNHSSYPTYTMMNAASFATGDFAGKTGFYGNTLWDPSAKGDDAEGDPVNFKAPVFTEDYKVLQDMDQPNNSDPLLFSATLFKAAHDAQLKTATVGKSGPAFLQDYRQQAGLDGIVFDEKHVYPIELAEQLEAAAYPLPIDSPRAFSKTHLTLSTHNGNPTGFDKVVTLNAISGGALGLDDDFMFPDNVTPDPSATDKSPYNESNTYLMDTFLDKILTAQGPDLSVVWLRNPDTTEHNYGVGSPSYYTALHDQDKLLGRLLARLKALKLLDKTDLLVASDHGHSNVSGPLTQFPLRMLHNGMVSVPDPSGYSTSGDFRPADLLSRAGFHAFDGYGCEYDPVLSGIQKGGALVYPILFDRTGAVCGRNAQLVDTNGHRHQPIGHLYTTPAYKIPAELPKDGIIIANNGGSSYFYVPSHNPKLLQKIVSFLQGRQEFGAIFIDNHYPEMAGTLPMSLVHILNPQGRNPDIIVGSNFDAKAKIRDVPGTEFNSAGTDRGMHGSFSPIDVHNTLLALGPDFKTHFVDQLPSGNVDVAPTIAYLLHLKLPNTDGRPLLEALKAPKQSPKYSVIKLRITPNKPASNIRYALATNPNGDDVDTTKSNYTIELKSKLLIADGKCYQYFDSAEAKRY